MKKIDLIGQRFGKLIVLERAPSHAKSSFWLCQCDCGKKTVVRGGNLTSGRTHSCGCQIPRNRLQAGEAVRNMVMKACESSAATTGVPWKLDREAFTRISKSNCYYCGAPPSKVITLPGCKGHFVCNVVGMIDKGKGYVEGNAIPRCHTCSAMKGKLSFEKFLHHVAKIAQRIPTIQGTRGHGVKQL